MLEEIACTLVHAIKLRELGVSFPSFASWINYETNPVCRPTKEVEGMQKSLGIPACMIYPAYTSEEIGRLLPVGSVLTKVNGGILLSFNFPLGVAVERLINSGARLRLEPVEREVDIKTEAVIFFVENKLIAIRKK